MPEGPSIFIVRDILQPFKGKTVLATQGNATIDKARLKNQRIVAIRSWGKHLLICFDDFTLRIHFLMFGTYLIDERKSTPLKLSLRFAKQEVNFYTCAVRLLEGKPEEHYDFTADIMNPAWNSRRAGNKMKAGADRLVCDVLMDQEIFSGVGNIMKNEVLYRTKIHPESLVGELPAVRKAALLREAKKYAFDFLRWKKAGTLKRHWQAYNQKTCSRDKNKMHKAITGKSKRSSFFCEACQVLYH